MRPLVEHRRLPSSRWSRGLWGSREVQERSNDWDPQGVLDTLAECNDALLGGTDPLTYAAERTVDQWRAYEQERTERMAEDEAYAQERREQVKRAGAKRKRKRRGLHLSNADRVRLAEEKRERGEHAVAAEHGLSVATASSVGQLVLFEEVA